MNHKVNFALAKRLFVGMGAVFVLLFLASCSDKLYEEKVAEKTSTEIVDAISARDLEALKGLFSVSALEQAQDINSDIEKLFEFFQDGILSVEVQGIEFKEKIELFKGTKQVKVTCLVVTEDDEYRMYFAEWTQEQENPDMVGLYSIQIVDCVTGYSEGFHFLPTDETSGIYIFERQ